MFAAIRRLLTPSPKVRKFRPVGGYLDGETSHLAVRIDGQGYQVVRHDGRDHPFEEDPSEFFSIAKMEERVAGGTWEEIR